jgi:hypothetical protein
MRETIATLAPREARSCWTRLANVTTSTSDNMDLPASLLPAIANDGSASAIAKNIIENICDINLSFDLISSDLTESIERWWAVWLYALCCSDLARSGAIQLVAE